jgi:single-strand DNA-binding protein
MAAFNKIILMGNLTRDPELRYTGGGAAVCVLRLAINRAYKTQSGELRDDTCYIDATCWGKQAESCNNYLRKGAPVFVEGFLRYETWTDKASGQTRSRHSVSAENIRFLGAPQRDSGGFSENPSPSQQGQASSQYSYNQQQSAPQYQQRAPQQTAAPAYRAPAQQNFSRPAPQPEPPGFDDDDAPIFEPPPMPEFDTEPEDDIPF